MKAEFEFALILAFHYLYSYLMVLWVITAFKKNKMKCIRYQFLVVFMAITTLYFPLIFALHFPEENSTENEEKLVDNE